MRAPLRRLIPAMAQAVNPMNRKTGPNMMSAIWRETPRELDS
jgi:hypothetical protein